MSPIGGERRQRSRHIVVSDRAGLPYSKGLMASSIMATGISPARAYEAAERIEDELLAAERYEITRVELRELATEVLTDVVGQRFAEVYRKWQSVEELDAPLIILIGGTTGVGKSTIATQLAARLGITRIVSTDAIREVMRQVLSERIMPALHTSSFDADRAVRGPVPRSADPVIVGFEEQVRAVAVGIQALVERSVLESTDTIIEGAHAVPGFIGGGWEEKAVIVPMVITVDDEDLHRSHFFLRGQDSRLRNVDRYLTAFQNIRKVQRYVRNLAMQREVPVISSYSLDATLAVVIDHIVTAAVERGEAGRASDTLSARTGKTSVAGDPADGRRTS